MYIFSPFTHGPCLFRCWQWTSSGRSVGFGLWARILTVAGQGFVRKYFIENEKIN